MPENPSPPARLPLPDVAAQAFARVEPAMASLKPDEIRRVNVAVPATSARALGVVPYAREVRNAIKTALPTIDLDAIDRLEDYAYAAWYAFLLTLPAETEDQVQRLLQEAVPLRDRLLTSGDALAKLGFMDAGRVAHIRSGQGHLDKANDLVELSALHVADWDRLKTRTAVEEAEVTRAATLGAQLLAALGLKQARTEQPKASVDRRDRAFTLLVNAYDTFRRAVTYLRWKEGDADTIAPSLFDLRSGR